MVEGGVYLKIGAGSQTHLACCCLLMRRGADVNASDKDGRWSALSSAAARRCNNTELHRRFVLQLLLLGGIWDENAAEAVVMAVHCGAQVAACDSMENNALAAAVAVASLSLSPQLDASCLHFPFLESACLRLVREGGVASLPRHSHVQTQQEPGAALQQLPVLTTCIRLGWRKLTLELLNQGLPLHPSKETLQALCR